jgi:hypothetical protein
VTTQIFWLKTRAKWRETPVELKHSGSIATRDLSQVSDEDLWNMLAKLDAEIGLTRIQTIDADSQATLTPSKGDGLIRLVPRVQALDGDA